MGMKVMEWEHDDSSTLQHGDGNMSFQLFQYLDESCHYCDKHGDGKVATGTFLAWGWEHDFSKFLAWGWEMGTGL